MITMAKNPSFAWLKISNKESKSAISDVSVWGKIGAGEILTHRSWISLWMIIKWAKKQFQKEKPVLYVPEYYCYDTIFQIEDEVDIVYYPILDSLEPDLKACRKLAGEKKPDLFLFVHFYGKIFPINDASVFCRQQNSALIEDAAHVLISPNKIGKNSDFILFSPWKLLGLPDGAVLIIGKKNHYIDGSHDMIEYFQELQDGFLKDSTFVRRWKWKKIILKFMPLIRVKEVKPSLEYSKEIFLCISNYSKKILLQISLPELMEIGEQRKEICMYMEEYCSRNYGAQPLLGGMEGIPYTAAIRVDEKKKRDQLSHDFQKVGNIVSRWPSLSPEIKPDTVARELYEDVVVLAVHGDIKLSVLVKRLQDKWKSSDNEITCKRVTREQYDIFCSEVNGIVPLLQSSIYGQVKQEIQSWIPEYYSFYNRNQIIAFCMILKKKTLPFIYRINQGVIWKGEPDEEMRYQIYSMLAHHFSGKGKILFFASYEHRDGKSIALMCRNKFFYRNRYESTGYIDLRESEEVIRKNLDSKWRNQLKAAEGQNFAIDEIHQIQKLESLLELHIRHKKDANYTDSGDDITKVLIKLGDLIGFCIQTEEQGILAFIMIACHGKGATYYIGWCSEQGYRYNLNKLLLWRAMIILKDRGIQWFDLGGIDFIHTPGIAEFKMGTGCMYYETVGEFVRY